MVISIVVLDGSKVLRDVKSVEPLRYALGQVVKQEDDQLVVLVIFNSGDLPQSPVISGCCIATDGRKHQPSETETYIRILREEISQGTEAYMKLFRPFYKECKSIGVKFMVKIIVGSTIDAIISEEKNITGATSVLMGRSFAIQHGQWATQKNCKLSYNDEEIVVCTYSPLPDVPESSRMQTQRLKKKPLSHGVIYCTLPSFEGIYQPSSSSSSCTNNESLQESDEKIKKEHECGFLVHELSWEVIWEITNRFMNVIQFEGFQMYSGYLEDQGSAVFVKWYYGTECRYILEAEKKATLTMYHKNILGLYGYHKNDTAMALVFSYNSGGALMERFLNGCWTKVLNINFQTKMDIATKIAKGLRYMHEQCPRGPIVHSDLRPCNILLGNNLEPQITGFGHAKWLQVGKLSLIRNSCGHMHPSDQNSMALIKSDILAFGILLLRLFCNRNAPRDDKAFVAWARPLLAQRAYHILFDESECDVHGLLVVTTVAARCISTRPNSRPCMSKVLSYLIGEVCCADQTFPSTESSPNLASTPELNVWEL